MEKNWKLFKASVKKEKPIITNNPIEKALNIIENFVDDLEFRIPIGFATIVQEAYKELRALNHNPEEIVLWIESTGNNPSPILYTAMHAVACEIGWEESEEKKHSWSLAIGLKEIATKETFKESVKFMFDEIKDKISKGDMSYQVLETACWIRPIIENVDTGIFTFYDFKDIACEIGWIQESKWVN